MKRLALAGILLESVLDLLTGRLNGDPYSKGCCECPVCSVKTERPKLELVR